MASLTRLRRDSQLLCAIRTKDVMKASNLLQAGVDVDTHFTIRSQMLPAISVAVEENDYEMVRMLLQFGASLNTTSSNRENTLFMACCRGNIHMVRILLENNNSNVNIETGNDRRTPLHAACIQGSPDIVKILISHGANIESQDSFKYTPLHLAALHGHSEVCSILLDEGASCGVLDSNTNAPVFYAVSKNCDLDVILEMTRLCSNSLFYPNKQGVTTLMTAICCTSADKLDELLPQLLIITKSQVNDFIWSKILNRRTDLGHTMLHYAVLEKNINCVRILLSMGALVNSRDNLGQTPLISAVKNGCFEIVRMLMAAGATTRMLVCNSEIVCEKQIDTETKDVLVEGTKTPLPLANFCRIHYNRKYGIFTTNQRNMPKRFVNFLKYNEVNL